MKIKIFEQQEARRLRRDEGLSINDICNKLHVSKSSVSYWVRDIILTDDQVVKLKNKNPIFNNQIRARNALSKKRLSIRASYQEEGKQLAKLNEPLHIIGCILYWGEGAKDRNSCVIVNTDSNLLLKFKQFLEYYFPKSNIKIKINCYQQPTLNQIDIENYWLNLLKLDRSKLNKTQFNNKPRSANKLSTNLKYPYGMCTIIVNSTQIVQHIYGALQVYGSCPVGYGLNFR